MAWVLLLVVDGNAPAADTVLDIDPGRSVLGLSVDAKPAKFRKALGAPAAEIAMTGDRRGLPYGRNMLLVFNGDTLWEARTWQNRNWTPQLFHEWLQYVPDTGQSFSVAGEFSVGMRRDALEQQLGQRLLDEDEFSLVREGDAWRIDDIEYLGDWDFKPGARLSEVLQRAE